MNKHLAGRKAILHRINGNLGRAVRAAMEEAGFLGGIRETTRVALKPNFTYPYYRPGVTTSPQMIRETVRILREYTSYIAIVETDGGYGAWQAKEAFAGHGLPSLVKEFGVEAINLCEEPSEMITFQARWKEYQLPLPVRLLRETDIIISMPVPKIHCMTGLTLSYKNQWGCIPDTMRLRKHYIFDDAIIAINKALHPVVLADGSYFLDRNGPMEGFPVKMDLVIAASDVGSFDRYVSELMGFPWNRVTHLRRAREIGDMPKLAEIECNIGPSEIRTHVFHLERTMRNWIALSAFKSRVITWFGYESWFGRVVLHKILYLIAGEPVKPQPESEKLGVKKVGGI